MVKRLNLATRAFGAEPGIPGVAGLAAWIAEHRGTTADITTYLLDRSLSPQISAGIMTTCAGGLFYADRLRQSVAGIEGTSVTGELQPDTGAVTEDAARIVVLKKGSWSAMPAPHVLHLTDAFYGDAEEWNEAICGAYRTLMRAMRDTGVAGHVLIADTMEPLELALLARQKVFFFARKTNRENLAALLEFQEQAGVMRGQLEVLISLMHEYTVRKIFILDADHASIETALTHFDPDQIVMGGYCKDCSESYWTDLASLANFIP